MAFLRNEGKAAALNNENCEENPGNNQAQSTNVAKSQKDYLTQVSEEIEGRIAKKLSKEFNRTESRILSALSRLDEFFLNPLLQDQSGSAPETSRNALNINHGTIEDDSQDPHPEARVCWSPATQMFGPYDSYDRCVASKHVKFLNL